jgi:hypothetical protein
MNFTAPEQEAIILNAAWTAIDEMVNFRMFDHLGDRTSDIVLGLRTENSLRLFNILLGDFLSPLTRIRDRELPFGLSSPLGDAKPSDRTFLFYLRRVSESPQFCANADMLRESVEAFANWLEAETQIPDVWLPSIETNVNLTIQRIKWLKICANIGKHNFMRLEANVGDIVKILSRNGVEIDERMGYAIIPEFWEWFHDHLFSYHFSAIAEFLNNIRWAIFGYLRPEFDRSYHVTSYIQQSPISAFHYPAGVENPIAQAMYWDLMNMARREPYFPRFTSSDYLKQRYPADTSE